MAMTTSYSKVPADWIAGYTLSTAAGAITNMNTAFPEMTLAEADHATGDFANMLYAMMHKFYALYAALTVLKPTNMQIFKSENTDTVTGVITTSFTVVFKTAVAVGSQNVIAES